MKKKIALLMAMTISVTAALSGCGNDDASPSSSDTPKTEQASSDAEDSSADQGEEGDAGASAGKSGSITVMVYDRGTMPSSEGTFDDNRWANWIKENAPVENIEFVSIPRQDATETMNANFAAGTLPDVLPNFETFLPFYQNGVVMSITDDMLDKMPNYKALLDAHPIMRKSATMDGQIAYFTKFSNISPNHSIVIRKDWLDNLGLELPKTAEDLYNIIHAFTYDDPDGNGADDTWGINLSTDAQRVLSHMYGFPNPAKYKFDDNGELTYAWDNIEGWLTFTKRLVDEKLVNPDFITMNGDDDQADFLSGKIGVYCSGRFSNASRFNLYTSFKEAFPDATLETFALPETEFGRYCAYLNGGASTVGFLNSQCKDVDAAIAYVDWLYDPEVSEYLFYGPDGEYNKMNDYGTYAVVDTEKNAVEFDWATDYHVIQNELLEGREEPIDAHANDYYNMYLASDDPIMQEFGDLQFKMFEIANESGVDDPRKWLNDGLPALPSELDLIKSTADKEVDDMLKAALTDSGKSAADAVQEAKDAWYDAGGQQVDDYYKEYYKTEGDNALLASDFTNAKSAPVMTEAAKANSKIAQ